MYGMQRMRATVGQTKNIGQRVCGGVPSVPGPAHHRGFCGSRRPHMERKCEFRHLLTCLSMNREHNIVDGLPEEENLDNTIVELHENGTAVQVTGMDATPGEEPEVENRIDTIPKENATVPIPESNNTTSNTYSGASSQLPDDFVPQYLRTVDLESMAVVGDGPPRICSPLSMELLKKQHKLGSLKRDALPLMVYLPGIDGTGLAAARQFPSLLRNFDLVTLITPSGDRSDFNALVRTVIDYLESEVPLHSPERPIYLLGESFGGILALAVAAECPGLVDRIVLVNPATSFSNSIWSMVGPLLPQIPREAYKALPIALAPILGNPINLLAASLDGTEPGSPIEDQINTLVTGAAGLLRQLPLLADLLPPETLAWKLHLLEEGCKNVSPKFSKVSQRVLIIVGEADALIPSLEEGQRLKRLLPRSHLRVEKGRAHALLQEGGVDLVKILHEEGVLITRRRLSAPMKERNPKNGGFGTASPIELPTFEELERVAGPTTTLGRQIASPVFFSTSTDGTIAQGLGYVPTPEDWVGNCGEDNVRRPVLFVGNHQSLALDLGVLVEELLRNKGILLRGLAHPVIFSEALAGAREMSKEKAETNTESKEGQNDFRNALSSWIRRDGNISPFDIIPTFGRLLRNGGDMLDVRDEELQNPVNNRRAFADFMTEFGAVPVSARNMIQLLKNGESVLLFPGGVREAYRRKNEEYKLFWPKRAEFVRLAAKYNAIIVPFAATGVDDSLEIILDNKELQDTPILGNAISQRSTTLPQARRGVSMSEDSDMQESFIAPLAVPKFPPNRMYFVFGKPIYLDSTIVDDRDRCQHIYEDVKAEVEAGLRFSLEGRKKDPYADFTRRIVWEMLNQGKTAPTFDVDNN